MGSLLIDMCLVFWGGRASWSVDGGALNFEHSAEDRLRCPVQFEVLNFAIL